MRYEFEKKKNHSVDMVYYDDSNDEIGRELLGKDIELLNVTQDIDTGVMKMNLRVYTSVDEYIDVTENRDTVLNRPTVLTKYGADCIGSKKQALFAEYIHLQENGYAEKLYTHSLLGWHNNHYQAYYSTDRNLNSIYSGKIDISPHGCFDVWRDMVISCVLPYVPLNFGVVLGLSAVVVGYMQDRLNESILCHIYGDSSMKEKAKAYKHCGGQPPLGLSVDANGDYHINQSEAVIVRDLFDMYANGMSYNEILKVFDEKNYRTRSGKPFGKNSFYELLHNPKMMGTYVFNRRSSKSRYSQTSNSHLNKPNEEMIIKTNAIPAIVSPQLFDKVQKRLKQNKDRRGANKAKQRYLLSSKVVCGECGCNFHGNSRKNGKGIVYSSYRCNKKNMSGKCGNTEISREHLEKYVCEHLRKMLLTKEVKKRVIAEVAKYRRMTNDSARQEEKRYKNELIGVQKKIENIVNVIAQGNTIDSLTDKLKELEQNKKSLEQSLANLDVKYSDITITEQQYDEAVSKLDEFMQANTYDFNVINFIDKCVDKIVVYKDYVEVTFMVTSFLMGESTRYVKIRVTATRNEVMGRHRSYKNNIYVPPTERNIDIFVE